MRSVFLYFEPVTAVLLLIARFLAWAFTRGWPVGLGLMALGLASRLGLPDWACVAAFAGTAAAGYAWKLRRRIWPERFGRRPPGPPGVPPWGGEER